MNRVLFERSSINSMALENRLVRSATYEAMAGEDGCVTDDHIGLYTKLAKGGVGLIIAGFAYVHKNGVCGPRQLGISDDRHVPGLKRLTDAVHAAGGKICSQIAHAGRQTTRALLGGIPPLAPSDLEPDPFYHTVPRAMTGAEIEVTIEAFVNAALRSKAAGFDAVQLHAAHGYLIAQFLSPHTNRRTDEWGGHIENRMRFPLAVVDRVRAAVGPDYPVMIKLSVEERVPNGMTTDEACIVAGALKEHGVDAIEVSGGILVDTIFSMCRGDIPIDMLTERLTPEAKAGAAKFFHAIADQVAMKEAYWADQAAKVKAAVGELPLIVVGGMRYPQTMENIITDGKADYIALSRALVREPSLPREMAEGRRSPVKCAYCNRCLAKIGTGAPLRCYNQ